MSTTGSLIVYISIWWIVFFSVLPIGIKSENAKFTDRLQGNDPGAPKNPEIKKKFLITTLITSIIFLVIYYLVSQNYLNLRGYLQ
jgi:predicted secreted protein